MFVFETYGLKLYGHLPLGTLSIQMQGVNGRMFCIDEARWNLGGNRVHSVEQFTAYLARQESLQCRR